MESISLFQFWNLLLTGMLGVMWYFIRGKFDELKALHEEINVVRTSVAATREEMARSSLTRDEFRNGMDAITKRLDELSAQLVAAIHGRVK